MQLNVSAEKFSGCYVTIVNTCNDSGRTKKKFFKKTITDFFLSAVGSTRVC